MPKAISHDIIEKILPLYKTGLNYREVADKLGISHATVGRIVRESGYDRTHVGSTIAKSIPISNEMPMQPANPLRVTSRTLKLHSDVTGHTYTVSTESEIIEIDSDSALMQLPASAIDAFISELQRIKTMLGNPS